MQDQAQRLFGTRTPRQPENGGEGYKLHPSLLPAQSHYYSQPRLPKTMQSDVGVYQMLSNHAVHLDENFIEGKSPLDILLEKQQRMLSQPQVIVEAMKMYRARAHGHKPAAFIVRAYPFQREEECVRLLSAQEEKVILETIMRLYRPIREVKLGWAKEAIYIGKQVHEMLVLVIETSDSVAGHRVADVLEAAAMRGAEHYS